MDPNEKPGAPGDPNYEEPGDETQHDQFEGDEGTGDEEGTRPRTPEKKPLSMDDITPEMRFAIQREMLGEGAEEYVKSPEQLTQILHDQRAAHAAAIEAEERQRAKAESAQPLSRMEEIERDLQILAIQDRNEGCNDQEIERRYRARYMTAIKQDAVQEVRQEMMAQRERGKALDLFFKDNPHAKPLRDFLERDLDAGVPPKQALLHYKQVADSYKAEMTAMSPAPRGGQRMEEEPRSSRAFSAEAYQRAVESVRDQPMEQDNLVPDHLVETSEMIKKAPAGANLYGNKYWAKAAAKYRKQMQE